MRKTTKIIIVSAFILFIIYDIIALIAGGVESTLSNVMLVWVYTLPAVSYGLLMIVAHFLSFIKINYKSSKHYFIMAGISLAVILLTLITYFNNIKIHPAFSSVTGFIVGTTLWSQRRK